MEKGFIAIGKVVIALLNLVLTMFTISTLWGWFIVPLGAPVIGWAQAYGIALIAAWLTVRSAPNFNPGVLRDLTFGQKVGKTVGVNLGVLLVGWIATLFM